MSGGGQGMSAGGGGQFGGLPLGNGGVGQVPGRPPMMGGGPRQPPMMYPGGPGGREMNYPAPMPGTGGPDQMGGQDATQRNPMLGGIKSPMGPQGQMPEEYLRMMQMRQQQQQGLLGQPTMQAGLGLPPGVSMGMSPPRMPPQQPGGGDEMAQIMAQYQPR